MHSDFTNQFENIVPVHKMFPTTLQNDLHYNMKWAYEINKIILTSHNAIKKKESHANISREVTKTNFHSKRKLFSPKKQGQNKFKIYKIPISVIFFSISLSLFMCLFGFGFVGLCNHFRITHKSKFLIIFFFI